MIQEQTFSPKSGLLYLLVVAPTFLLAGIFSMVTGAHARSDGTIAFSVILGLILLICCLLNRKYCKC